MANPDLAERIAQRALAERGAAYAAEVRRLLDAGLALLQEGPPRVADIVRAAGLSNDAFYRHFASKDAFVSALLEDGTHRLRSYLEHQMAKERTPEGRIRRWVEGVLAQAGDEDVATATRAVMTNGRTAGDQLSLTGPASLLSTLLVEPLAELGDVDAALHAALLGHAVVGRMSEHLASGSRPSRSEIARTVAFCTGGR